MTILLPLIGIYIVARAVDWMITGGNHIDGKISVKLLVWILIVIFIYGILRNIPVFPFNLLAPGGPGRACAGSVRASEGRETSGVSFCFTIVGTYGMIIDRYI